MCVRIYVHICGVRVCVCECVHGCVYVSVHVHVSVYIIRRLLQYD